MSELMSSTEADEQYEAFLARAVPDAEPTLPALTAEEIEELTVLGGESWEPEAPRRPDCLPSLPEPPPMPHGPVTLDEARALLTSALRELLRRALEIRRIANNTRSLLQLELEAEPETAAQLQAEIDRLAEALPQFAIIAETGVGKTTSIVRVVAELGATAVIALPDNNAARRVAAEIGEDAGYWPALTATDADGAPYCDRSTEVRPMLEAGISHNAICERCPLRDHCRAVNLRHSASRKRFMTITHDTALSVHKGLGDRDFFIADEVINAPREPVAISMARLRSPPTLPSGRPIPLVDRAAQLLLSRLEAEPRDAAVGQDRLVFSESQRKLLQDAARSIWTEIVRAYDAGIKNPDAFAARWTPIVAFAKWMQAIADHLPQLGKRSGRVFLTATDKILITPMGRVGPMWAGFAVVISMSATPAPVDHATRLGRDEVVTIRLPPIIRPPSIKLIRVTGAPVGMNKVVTPGNFARVTATVRRLASGRTVVFVQARHVARFRSALPDLQVESWSEAIGSNAYECFDTVVVLGQSRLPPEEALLWQAVRTGEQLPSASYRTAWLKWREEGLVKQAIGRIRPYADKGGQQIVWVLDPAWPSDLEPDQEVGFGAIQHILWAEGISEKLARLTKGSAIGVPSSWEHGANICPGEFASAGALQRFRTEIRAGRWESLLLERNLLSRSLDSERPAARLHEVDYRLAGTSNWSTILTRHEPQHLQAALGLALGAVVEVKGSGANELPDALPASWRMLLKLGLATTERRAKTMADELAELARQKGYRVFEASRTDEDGRRSGGSPTKFWVHPSLTPAQATLAIEQVVKPLGERAAGVELVPEG